MDFAELDVVRPKKIAFVNPYLQGKHYHIAETESGKRFVKACNHLGMEAEIFDSSSKLDIFKPDLVVGITYQEAKLSCYPTYLALNTPFSLLDKHKRFERNILSYDGIITLSETTKNWYRALCKRANKKPVIVHGGVTTSRVDFKNIDYKNAKAMYIGTNWDGGRHAAFFNSLKNTNYLRCYGPAASWTLFQGTLYAGSVPFDGYSVYDEYRMNGIGLCIGHPEFDKHGVLNNRHYEVPAASAIAICSINETVKQIYGDSVLYLDQNSATDEMVQAFIAQVEWVRHNPRLAREMAEEANKIYNDQLALEACILELVNMESQYKEKTSLFYQAPIEPQLLNIFSVNTEADIKWLAETLGPVANEMVCWVKCTTDQLKLEVEALLKLRQAKHCWVTAETDTPVLLLEFIANENIKWCVFRDPSVVYSENSIEQILSAYLALLKTHQIQSKQFLYPSYYECLPGYHLADYIIDNDKIYDENNIRIGDIENTASLNLGCVLIDSALLLKQPSLLDSSLCQKMQNLINKSPVESFYHHRSLLVGVNLDAKSMPNIKSVGVLKQDALEALSRDELLIYIKDLKSEVFNLNIRLDNLQPGLLRQFMGFLLMMPLNIMAAIKLRYQRR
jgi:hypothetical protein